MGKLQLSASCGSGRLYQRATRPTMKPILATLLFLMVSACASPKATAGTIVVSIVADGNLLEVNLPAGSTVQAAVELAGIHMGELDRVEPAVSAVLTDGAQVPRRRRA